MIIDLKHGEPIRFGADSEHGVALNEFGECEIVDVAASARTSCSCTTSTATTRRWRSRCRGSPISPTVPTPMGVFRDVDRPTYEGAVQHQLVAASERQGPGDLAALLSSGASWDGRLDAADSPRPAFTRRRSARITMPVRGLGAKNVVFCGIRTPASARPGSEPR